MAPWLYWHLFPFFILAQFLAQQLRFIFQLKKIHIHLYSNKEGFLGE